MKKIFLTTLVLTALLSFETFAAKKAPAKSESKSVIATLDVTASKIKWVGRKIVGPHNGTVNLKEGSVTLEGTKPTAATFTIDMTSIKDEDLTNADFNKKLVDHLSSDDFFAVKTHPTSVFVLTKATPGKNGEFTLTGDMTIKGITKSITFPAKIVESKGVYSATAKFKINRTDWGVKYNSGKFFDPKTLGDKLINDDIEIELDLKTTATGA